MSANWIAADWPAPAGIIAGTTLRNGDFAELPLAGEPCWLNQVHGARVVEARAFQSPPNADASIGRNAGDICVVKTADCLPVLFCSSTNDEVAAAHAGWRGLAAGVLENSVARMSAAPGDVLAWLGPAISQPSFEVGDEVRDVFLAHDRVAMKCFIPNDHGKWQADLYSLARQRLNAVGVTEIHGGGSCTYLEAERFFSYRRNPNCGRMISFVSRSGT